MTSDPPTPSPTPLGTCAWEGRLGHNVPHFHTKRTGCMRWTPISDYQRAQLAETSDDTSGADASPPCETLLRNLVIAVDRYVECDERPRPTSLWQAMTSAARACDDVVYPL